MIAGQTLRTRFIDDAKEFSFILAENSRNEARKNLRLEKKKLGFGELFLSLLFKSINALVIWAKLSH